MNCIIYVCDNSETSIYQKFNECAKFASRFGFSISGKIFDFTGNEFYKAIDKVVFNNEIGGLMVYNLNSIGDFETAIFYRIYLEKFGKKLISYN